MLSSSWFGCTRVATEVPVSTLAPTATLGSMTESWEFVKNLIMCCFELAICTSFFIQGARQWCIADLSYFSCQTDLRTYTQKKSGAEMIKMPHSGTASVVTILHV